ncbi:Na+/H+ antiporter subunit E [Aurantimonas aggregata]|uniref:Na+/H+ antiporter subunit E n=1 Tax=Aurantimonas aggregata TaxID=2047720 RepID=UPI00194215E1
MTRSVAAARRLVLFAALWFVLTDGEGAALGAVVVLAASWLSLRLLPTTRPLRMSALLAIVPGFVWRSLLGGVDVARRALDPRLPLDPGWIEIPVDLTDGGRVALGGELSLMPGTLVAGSANGRLLVHVLDRQQDTVSAVRNEAMRMGKVAG